MPTTTTTPTPATPASVAILDVLTHAPTSLRERTIAAALHRRHPRWTAAQARVITAQALRTLEQHGQVTPLGGRRWLAAGGSHA